MVEIPSPLGTLRAEASSRGVVSLLFGPPSSTAPPGDPGGVGHLEALRSQLEAYFAGRLRAFSVPLDLRGTPFQREVWTALREISFGETRTYEELAALVRRPAAVRAAGAANGANPVAIVVPCHRVVAKDGTLGGYGGGLDRKRALLELEGALPPAECQRALFR